MRYIGEEVKISPTWDKSTIHYITEELYQNQLNNMCSYHPAFWLEYDGVMYFGMCVSVYFSVFDNIRERFGSMNFNIYQPKNKEFDYLISTNPKFYKLDYLKATSGDLGEWCDYELDFIKV